MIIGSNADCNIKNISISETTATISLLIFAIKSTKEPIALKAYLKDVDTGEETLLSNKTYWIDNQIQSNNNQFSNNTTHVNTNKYKEIILNVDITNKNEAQISENRWVRSIYIILKDSSTTTAVWTSEVLTLVSDEFEIPDVSNIHFKSIEGALDETINKTKFRIQTNFSLTYRSEKDFNYNNKNFSAVIYIKSPMTNEILETVQVYNQAGIKQENSATTSRRYEQNEPVIIELVIANKNGEVFFRYKKTYKPNHKQSRIWVKTNDGWKRVSCVYLKDKDEIYTNYNNGYLNKPKSLVPQITAYRDINNRTVTLMVNSLLFDETFYKGYQFDIYVNDKFFKVNDEYDEDNNITDKHYLTIRDLSLYQSHKFSVYISGYYKTESGYRYNINSKQYIIKIDSVVASDETYISNELMIADIIEGYLSEGKFYKADGTEVVNPSSTTFLADTKTNKVYVYNRESEIIELI